MELMEAVKTRRSIRKWKDKPIPDKLIKKLIDSARHAPSSMNRQPWEFVVIKDEKVLDKIMKPRENGDGEDMHPPCMIAICVDKKRSPYRWIEDGSVAAQNMLLAAHDVGLGAVWLTAYKDPVKLRKSKIERIVIGALDLPRFVRPLCLIALGYADEEPKEKELRPIVKMTHFNKFGHYWKEGMKNDRKN